MAIKKSELYGSLWRSCDELRGGMDASQYKDYVLALLFVKYVSDKYAGQRDALIDVPAGGGFADMVALKGDKEIGEKINKIIGRLAEANDLKGVIDVADFNDADKLGKGKEMVDRLSNLVSIFNTPALDFRGNRAEGDDILGDAYEYLMKNFATQSGKSKGQFYTPAEVSRIMAKVIGIGGAGSSDQAIYDPTCGSGSLLLKAHDEAPVDVTIYGQEMDNATAALAKMNMILHDCPTAEIWQDNTLSEPHFKNGDGSLKTFDYAVANPPFSTKAWSNGFDPANDLYGRFAYGIPPAKNGDYAFLLHILASLKSTGKAAVVLPHGVLFRGNAEAVIFGHPEFTAYNEDVAALFSKWRSANTPGLKAIAVGGKPKALIASLSEDLLETFRKARLLDPYDVYQHLMDFWAATMQDDVYLLVQEGWQAVLDGRPNTDLIPERLIIIRYFGVDQAAIDDLEAAREAVAREIEEIQEEHGGEDGLLTEARNDKGSVTKASLKARLAAAKAEGADDPAEIPLLKKALALIDQESDASRKVKDATKALGAKVAAKYAQLTEAEIKTLVVDDKWLTAIAAAVQGELDRVSQTLTTRIRVLADRYAAPLPRIVDEVAALAAKVDGHLKQMGIEP